MIWLTLNPRKVELLFVQKGSSSALVTGWDGTHLEGRGLQ